MGESMKKRAFAMVLIGALMAVSLGILAACGGSAGGSASASSSAASSSAAQATEFAFFSVVIPEGYEQPQPDKYYVSSKDGGALSVSVHNTTADELLAVELKDEDFARGDDVQAGDFTWKVAHSDKWNQTYYIADWENGSVEVSVKGVSDDSVVKGFLSTLKPAEDAYHKWQQAS